MVVLCSGGAAFAVEPGKIQGRLVDSRNQSKAAGRAAVFVCDPATGYPLVAKTRKPLGDGGITIQEMKELWHVVTEPDGSFSIGDVPPGKYRLVAQSWGGVEGVPDQKNSSEILNLHGCSEPIEVTEREGGSGVVRALGNGTLKVVCNPEEASAYLFVSTGKMLGDPILSYFGWGDDFLKSAVGMAHMSKPRMTITGLPEDKDVAIATFHYDNVPGTGGGSFRAGKDAVATIAVYAGWSNGRDDPPAKLLPVVEYLEKNDPPLAEVMELGPPADFQDEKGRLDRRKLWKGIQENAEKTITIEGVGKTRVIDLAAADSYRLLRAHHKQQRERKK